MEKHLESISLRVNSTISTAPGVGSLIGTTLFAKLAANTYPSLPQPLDIASTRSFSASFLAGSLLGLLVGRRYEGTYSAESEKSLKHKVRATMALAGLATGAVVNTYVAKKLGIDMSSILSDNASNLANAGYSMAGGTTGALLNRVNTAPQSTGGSDNTKVTPDVDLGQTLGLGQSGLELPD